MNKAVLTALGIICVTSPEWQPTLQARSLAKNGYDIDPDQDFAALGAANVASAMSQSFAVSGADSRTAMSDATLRGSRRYTGGQHSDAH
jgi:MFS superfamily sulfate permease-like transporter